MFCKNNINRRNLFTIFASCKKRNQMKVFYTFLCLSLILFSCEQNETIIDTNNLLIGNWVSPTYNGEETTFTRSNSLPKEAAGISFIKNGKFQKAVLLSNAINTSTTILFPACR